MKQENDFAEALGNFAAITVLLLYATFVSGVGFWAGLRFIEEFLP